MKIFIKTLRIDILIIKVINEFMFIVMSLYCILEATTI